ncbi:MAG: glutamate racemase [Burkholderiales bacterium]
MLINITPTTAARHPRIGIFDSGVGGLSVLRELQLEWPSARLHYVADSGHAPYGERSDSHVLARSRAVAAHLIESGADILVIACNTATAAAVQSLREAWPHTPIVGVEPGIKPALAATRNGRIGVMATRGTLNSEKFKRLVASLAPRDTLYLRACDGLAAAIEQGSADAPEVRALVEHHCKPLREAGIDTVVLGCTHYAFARRNIQAELSPAVLIIDTAAAVARRAASIGHETRRGIGAGAETALPLLLQTTGNAEQLGRIASAWLGAAITASRITA